MFFPFSRQPVAAADKEENNNNNHEVDMKQENGLNSLKRSTKHFFQLINKFAICMMKKKRLIFFKIKLNKSIKKYLGCTFQ